MSSSARLYVVGIVTAGVVVWSLADFGREAHAPTDTELSVPPPTPEDHLSDPRATDDKGGMAGLDVADLRGSVALLRSDLARVHQQLRRLAYCDPERQLASSSTLDSRSASSCPG